MYPFRAPGCGCVKFHSWMQPPKGDHAPPHSFRAPSCPRCHCRSEISWGHAPLARRGSSANHIGFLGVAKCSKPVLYKKCNFQTAKLVPFLFQLWRTSDPNLPGCTPEAWHQGLLCPGVATCSRLTPFPISTWNCKKGNRAWLPSSPDGPKDDAQAQGPRHWAALRFVGFHS